MTIRFSPHKAVFLAAALSAYPIPARPQALEDIKSPRELTAVIASLDTALFDSYNRCEIDKFVGFFDPGVEFYHDQTGLAVGSESLAKSIRENICGKVTRELVPGSLEVYRMKGFGAVEIGVHRFHHPGRDGTEPVGEAKFIHLWHYGDGGWKITRVISFDHHALTK